MEHKRFRSDDIRSLWQNQPTEIMEMNANAIRGHAADYQRHVRRRNVREYGGAAVVVTAFLIMAATHPSPVMWTGSGLMIVACLFVGTQLHRTGASQPVPEELGRVSGIRFHRQELERQLAVYEQAWKWLFAFTPGLIVLLAGAFFCSSDVTPDSRRLLGVIVVAGGWVPIIVWVKRRNASKGARLRREIARLVEAETEA